MPAFDTCHEQVVRALQKEGWRVDDRPPRLSHLGRVIIIDIRAVRRANGRSQQILLVEVKCFPDRNTTTRELYIALGQYLIYRAMLAERRADMPLYLAIPDDAYRDIFDSTVQRAISDNQIKMVIVNLAAETITEWKE